MKSLPYPNEAAHLILVNRILGLRGNHHNEKQRGKSSLHSAGSRVPAQEVSGTPESMAMQSAILVARSALMGAFGSWRLAIHSRKLRT